MRFGHVLQSLATGTALSSLRGRSNSYVDAESTYACSTAGDALNDLHFPKPFFIEPLNKDGYRRRVEVRSAPTGPSEWGMYVLTLGEKPTYTGRYVTTDRSGYYGLPSHAKDNGSWDSSGNNFTAFLGPNHLPAITHSQLEGYNAYQKKLTAGLSDEQAQTLHTGITSMGFDAQVEERVARHRYLKAYQAGLRYLRSGLSVAERVRLDNAIDPYAPTDPYDTTAHPEVAPYTSHHATFSGVTAETTEVAPRKAQTAEEQATTEAMTDPSVQEELARREMELPEFVAATLDSARTYTMDDVFTSLKEAVETLNTTDAYGTTKTLDDWRRQTSSVNPYCTTQSDFDAARKKVVLGLKHEAVSMNDTAREDYETDTAFKDAHSRAAERTSFAATVLEERIRWQPEGPRRPAVTVEDITLQSTETNQNDDTTATKGRTNNDRAATMCGDGSEVWNAFQNVKKEKLSRVAGGSGGTTSGPSNSSASGESTSASGAASSSRFTPPTVSVTSSDDCTSNAETTRSASTGYDTSTGGGQSSSSETENDPFSTFDGDYTRSTEESLDNHLR